MLILAFWNTPFIFIITKLDISNLSNYESSDKNNGCYRADLVFEENAEEKLIGY